MSKQSFIGTKQKQEKTRQKKALTNHEFHETLTDEMINAKILSLFCSSIFSS